MFIACHPVLSAEARVALTLRLLGGLTTPEIARAFLVSEPTIAQRIVRAKRTLSEAHVPFEVPDAKERMQRLDAVLGRRVSHFQRRLCGNVGLGRSCGPSSAEEALRLGRMLAALAPDEAEVHGLSSAHGDSSLAH